MDLILQRNSLITGISIPPFTSTSYFYRPSFLSNQTFSYPFCSQPFGAIPHKCFTVRARKRNPQQKEPVLDPTIVEQESMADEGEDEEEQLLFDEFEGEAIVDEGDDEGNGDFEEECLEDDDDDAEFYVGDGAGGGGISLAGTWWDKEALRIAEEVCDSFEGELKIYAFRTLSDSTIQVRIERLTNKSGSPSMEDIEAFSTMYRSRLGEAEVAKTIHDDIALEVSSPGVERVVQIPEDLDRFKEQPMYVMYVSEVAGTDSSSEHDGVFRLISFDVESKSCTWGLADVRINRENAGKGKPLSKKQREWRLNTPFQCLRLVHLYSEM